MLKALIFDVDGTLADTESAHLAAFNAAFSEVGLEWCWSASLYTVLLEIAGGRERLLHYWKMTGPEAADGSGVAEAIEALHAIKTRHYEALVADGRLALRPGVLRLIREALDDGLQLAIATTTTPSNVDVLLRAHLGRDWRRLFAVVCDGASVARKKPAPDVYLAALDALGLPAADCLAFEDSANGLRAAHAAGIKTIVTPTAYTAGHRFDDAVRVLPHLGDPGCEIAPHQWADLRALRGWHRSAAARPG